LAGHCVFDQANNCGDNGACYAAANRLTEQLTDVDAARRTLQVFAICYVLTGWSNSPDS
jgi:hypothetical protein